MQSTHDQVALHPRAELAESESLTERFESLCTNLQPNVSTNAPVLPALTPDEARFLSTNSNNEVFMTPEAIANANGPLRPAVLTAFRKALDHAFGHYLKEQSPAFDNDTTRIDRFTKSSLPAGTHPDNTRKRKKSPPSHEKVTFAQLTGCNDFAPNHDVTAFSWSESQSKAALDDFNVIIEKQRKEREAEEAKEAEQAMARATAAALRSTHQSQMHRQTQPKLNHTFNIDPVMWAAQEEAAASSVLRELRTGLSKLKKGSSRAPAEGNPIWALIAQKNSKLKPEAAAEMARARIAAAAAAAAIREDDHDHQPHDSLADMNEASEHTPDVQGAFDYFSSTQRTSRARTNQNSTPAHFLFEKQGETVFSKRPGFPRAISLDASVSLKSVRKPKRVAFAAGTVFGKEK